MSGGPNRAGVLSGAVPALFGKLLSETLPCEITVGTPLTTRVSHRSLWLSARTPCAPDLAVALPAIRPLTRAHLEHWLHRRRPRRRHHQHHHHHHHHRPRHQPLTFVLARIMVLIGVDINRRTPFRSHRAALATHRATIGSCATLVIMSKRRLKTSSSICKHTPHV